jgi:hypothetical protein
LKKSLVGLLLVVIGTTSAQARVFTAPPSQALASPFAPNGSPFSSYDLAIDGDSIIIVTELPGADSTAAALLYRRGTNGQWAFSRELYREPVNPQLPTPTAVMKNSLAVVKIGAQATFWEKVNNDWRRAPTAEPVTAPGGFAISQDRILAGGDDCTARALVYRRSAGVFVVEGNIFGNVQGECSYAAKDVELNYNYAMIRSGSEVGYWRRGVEFSWEHRRGFTVPVGVRHLPGAPALQNDRVVLPGNVFFKYDGSYWSEGGWIRPIDWPAGPGAGSRAVYRDGLVVNADGWDEDRSTSPVYIYQRNAGGTFDHLGVTDAWASTVNFDISGRTIVAEEYRDFLGASESAITIYQLPADVVKPRAIVNNFDARDVSSFTTSAGSQYAIAGNAYNYLYRQSDLTGDTSAVLEPSDWADFQRVTADVRPTAFARADGWAGLAARYLDQNNYYFVTLGNDDTVKLQRKLDGVVTTLAQVNASIPTGATMPVVLTVDGSEISADVGGGESLVSLVAEDSSLQSGRAAFLTSGARADFDNLHVAPTRAFPIFSIEPPDGDFGRPFTYIGGAWDASMRQSDTSGQALAVHGLLNVSDQRVFANVTVNGFATTDPVAWVGAIARYRDPRNFYYVSLRSSNQLQIRKVVNGQTTVLKAVNFSVAPGATYQLMFDVLGNELSASVNGVVLARAVDADISTGKFGVGTYRASATYSLISVSQP